MRSRLCHCYIQNSIWNQLFSMIVFIVTNSPKRLFFSPYVILWVALFESYFAHSLNWVRFYFVRFVVPFSFLSLDTVSNHVGIGDKCSNRGMKHFTESLSEWSASKGYCVYVLSLSPGSPFFHPYAQGSF